MQHFFITSSGTDIGKTLVTTTLCWQLRQMGKTVTALKPIVTGYDPHDMKSDTAMILKSCEIHPTPQLMKTVSPWRYAAQLSPNMASHKEGTRINLSTLVEFCREHAALESDVVLVEGVGGVMAPINDQHTVLDWMKELGWPTVLVVGSYLGTLSHTLTALNTLIAQQIMVRAIVVSESGNSAVPLDETVSTLEKFVPAYIPIVKIPRQRGKEELWKTVPLISWMCEE